MFSVDLLLYFSNNDNAGQTNANICTGYGWQPRFSLSSTAVYCVFLEFLNCKGHLCSAFVPDISVWHTGGCEVEVPACS